MSDPQLLREPPASSTAEPPAEARRIEPAPEPRIFVRASRATKRPLELLRLDSWGDSLLGSKLRGELATGYLILLVVCVFEVLAWTLLFNFMLHAGQMTTSLMTLVATGLGLLWGMGIFAFDKSLITADLLATGWKKYAGAGARIVLVLGAAFLTAQPIEQLVFRTLVEAHLKQEVLREEAVRYAQKLREVKQERDELKQQDPEESVTGGTKRDVDDSRRKKERLETELAKATEAANAAQWRVEQVEETLARSRRALKREQRADPESAATRQASAWVQSATADWRDATRGLHLARGQRQARQGELDRSSTELDKAKSERRSEIDKNQGAKDQKEAALAQQQQSYRHFLEALSGTAYGEPLLRESGEAFRWRAAGAVERMEALSLLRDNVAPRWPTADETILREAAALAGLGNDFSRSSEGSRELFGLWLVVVLVASAIPALCIFYKLTMSQELKLYYSVEAQASAGNPQALTLLHARKAIPTSKPPIAQGAERASRPVGEARSRRAHPVA